jgi:hypothetical protein
MLFNLLSLGSGAILVGIGAQFIVTDETIAWPLIIGGLALLLAGQTLARYDDIPGFQHKLDWLKTRLRQIGILPEAPETSSAQASSRGSNIPTAPSVRS